MRSAGQQVTGDQHDQRQKRSNHPRIHPPNTARRRRKGLNRPTWQRFEAGQIPAFRQIDPDGVGGSLRFVIVLQARLQFDSFHAHHAIQAWVIRRVAAENLDAEQCFLELIPNERLLDDEAQEPARPFGSGKCAASEDFVQLRADSLRRRLPRAIRAGANRSELFPCRSGHSLNWMIRATEGFGSFFWGPEGPIPQSARRLTTRPPRPAKRPKGFASSSLLCYAGN